MTNAHYAFAALLLLTNLVPTRAADEVHLSLAGTRSQFTTREPIEFALLYKNDGGDVRHLLLQLRHSDGSALVYRVPFDVESGKSQTRLVTVAAGTLKPGAYTATSLLGTQLDTVKFGVHPAEHANAYWTAQWVHHGESRGTTLAKGGWMFFNSDLATLHPRTPKPGDLAEAYVEARMRPFARMILGGGHQLDLDLHNDWGDPWVQRTIAWRMQLAALSNRIYPLAGLHCYDEPGLTWFPTKAVGEHKADSSPFSIPHQLEEFTKLTGKKMPEGPFAFTAPQYAGRMDDWLAFMDLRMRYLEQAWHATTWGTDSVEPRFTTINQPSSSYAPGTTTDGVDSRQNRAYRVVSGHGGYSDLPFGTMQPVRSAEAFRGYGWERPHYFLPMWYTHTWATIRNAVWMAWTTKLEGMMYTPEQDFGLDNSGRGYDGTHTVFEIAEINRRLARVGDVMRNLPKAFSPIAVLHSHRQFAHDIATHNSPKLHTIGAPQYVSPHHAAVDLCFFRVMEQGIAPNWIDEVEATEKGVAFLKQWKAILCPRLAIASPAFRKALEDYIAAGGKLIQFKGDQLVLKGSIVAEHDFGNPTQYYLERVEKTGGVGSPAYRDLAWRKWSNDLAPTFARDLAAWIGPQPYECSNKEVLLGIHRHGGATYLLFANNKQHPENQRGVKHELVPAETTVKLPVGGVVYDLFHGGEVPVQDGQARLRLAAGDGACWVHLPAPPGKIELAAGQIVTSGEAQAAFEVTWGRTGALPFRLRIIDPAGNVVEELYRSTTPGPWPSSWRMPWAPLARNAAPGAWTIEVSEWLTGQTQTVKTHLKGLTETPSAEMSTAPVSIYFDDAAHIVDLFAGKPLDPPYGKLNWDAKRVFGLDPKKFAVFGPEPAAEKVAAALRQKGMTVAVNPKYEIKPFEREPGRGGAGVSHGVASNLENIHAHAIVLPGHPLLTQATNRGHVNRPVTPTFPGPGRAAVQWGIGCFQAGWQNVFIQGDTDTGVAWLLDAIRGEFKTPTPTKLTALVTEAPAVKPAYPDKLELHQEIQTYDTPVGVASSPDGAITYVLLHDGSVTAHDAAGKPLWATPALLEGCALAISPKGDRLAVAGYPGLKVLDAKDGKVLGGEENGKGRVLAAAWNDAGTLVAAGWMNRDPKMNPDPILLDASGKLLTRPAGVSGNVMSVSFIPGGNVVLFGTDQLTAVNAADGKVLWKAAVSGAQAFAFDAERKTVAAGGWGKSVALVSLADGKVQQTANFPAVVGGVALLPSGDVAVAVWGGTYALQIMRRGASKPEPLFQSSFGFQNVCWWSARKALVAAEQGGRLWLLDDGGKPRALLDDAGTTAYRLEPRGSEILAARMNRVVQRLR